MKDLLILGAGPAGLAASVYASRYNIDHLLVGSEIGGYLNEIHRVENYLGFPSISGVELANNMRQHVESFGDFIRQETVISLEKIGEKFKLKTDREKTYFGKYIIYAIGTRCRKLNIPGENKFLGKGVSYCATCDGSFFKEKNVIVVGGGNSAAMAALILSEHAKTVLIVYRGDKLKSAPAYIDKINKTQNIKIIYDSVIEKIEGESVVENVVIKNNDDKQAMKIQGIFIEIGSIPNCETILKLGIEVNKSGFIITKPDQSTNVPNVFAAGDITTNSNGFRQIITAASEGAIATLAVFNSIKNT